MWLGHPHSGYSVKSRQADGYLPLPVSFSLPQIKETQHLNVDISFLMPSFKSHLISAACLVRKQLHVMYTRYDVKQRAVERKGRRDLRKGAD